MKKETFDYVVVGAGSAGCVVASRLSEDPSASVLLIEAGKVPRWWDFRLRIPAAKGLTLNLGEFNWGYSTVPQAQLIQREIPLYQGRVAGGSSAINGMVYARGTSADYDNWAKDSGLADWCFQGVLPYFEKLESHSNGGRENRGADGPLRVTAARGDSPLSNVFLEAGVEAGYPKCPDLNGAVPYGFGFMDMTVAFGRRVTAWDAYIAPILARPNLTIVTNTQVVRLVLEKSKCVGLEISHNGKAKTINATQEVILSSGVIGSPALLLRSGIGPADELRSLGISVEQDLPGVGANLHDHLQICVLHSCTQPVSLQPLARKATHYLTGARWLLTKSGWGATNHFEAGGVVCSNEATEAPDIQLLFSPHAFTRFQTNLDSDAHGFQVHATALRPRSRGRLRLRSSRHTDHPIIDPQYLSHRGDWAVLRSALRVTREILSQQAFKPFRGAEAFPGKNVQSNAEIDDYIRATANSGYHPCGTCKMGSGQNAVVDGSLRIRGIDGLRVADSSIMPEITSGNINAPTIMIGEKAADMIRRPVRS